MSMILNSAPDGSLKETIMSLSWLVFLIASSIASSMACLLALNAARGFLAAIGSTVYSLAPASFLIAQALVRSCFAIYSGPRDLANSVASPRL